MMVTTTSTTAKHPLEETKSWELYQQREKKEQHHRSLSQSHRHVKKKKKKTKSKIPQPGEDTFHAMMIDAGSQGTRIHVYEFERRILYHQKEVEHALNGLKLSTPTTNSRWTNRLKPGLDSCAYVDGEDNLMATLEEYLDPLLDFVKQLLSDKVDDWSNFPIYLKATGGLRTLPTGERIRLMSHVRQLFHNSTFNPFGFEDERARVISGEEEAIYGWAGVNFIKGTLVEESEGVGTVLNPNLTYGMIEMGGASTQIGFFENNGDLMANLFKLQIGGARHWNVYVHSFLYFGINGAWSRLNSRLVDAIGGVNNTATTFLNPCLPVNSEVTFSSWIHTNAQGQLLPRSSPLSTEYSVTMYNNRSDFESCSAITRLLLRKQANAEWVTFSHDGDASFAGIYQPPLPLESTGGFIATSNFADIWSFLQLDETSRVDQIGKAAEVVCDMTDQELRDYNDLLESPVKGETLYQYCFRSLFVYEMLHTGYGFPLDYEITAADTLNNQKLGWALGSILYEINTLPWEFGGRMKIKKNKEHSNALLGSPNQKNGLAPAFMSGGPGLAFVLAVFVGLVAMLIRRRRIYNRGSSNYESIPTTTATTASTP